MSVNSEQLVLILFGALFAGCAATYVPPSEAMVGSTSSPDNPSAMVQVTTSAGADPVTGASDMTIDLGAAADVLCVVQSAAGKMHGYCTPSSSDKGSSPLIATCDPTASSGSPLADAQEATGFDLYVNAAGHWELFTEGHPFSVTAACVPWSALGVTQAPSIVRVDASAVASTGTLQIGNLVWTPATPPPSATSGTCVLSSATDAYDNGAGASLTTGGLTVHGDGPNAMWSSATCFGDVPFKDLAAGSVLPTKAFCGLSELGDMSKADSSVSASGSTVTVVDANATARCFTFR